MRLAAFLVTCLAALLPAAAARAECSLFTLGHWAAGRVLVHYDGTLKDGRAARLTLHFRDESVTGLLVLAPGYEELRLAGRLLADSRIALEGAGGQLLGRFPERDPRDDGASRRLRCDLLEAVWQAKDGAPLGTFLALDAAVPGTPERRYAEAGVADDEALHAAIQRFVDAVRAENRAAIAASIAFPLVVTTGGRERARLYRGPAEFLAEFDKVFIPGLRRRILDPVPRNLVARYDGVRLGRGEVWFDAAGRVRSIDLSGLLLDGRGLVRRGVSGRAARARRRPPTSGSP